MEKFEPIVKHNVTGELIRQERRKKGWTQQELAQLLQLRGIKINQKAISQIERGERVLPDFELAPFFQVLGVAPDNLMKEADSYMNNSKVIVRRT